MSSRKSSKNCFASTFVENNHTYMSYNHCIGFLHDISSFKILFFLSFFFYEAATKDLDLSIGSLERMPYVCPAFTLH